MTTENETPQTPTNKPKQAHEAPHEHKPIEARTLKVLCDASDANWKRLRAALPKDENSPGWDARMNLDVPEGLIEVLGDGDTAKRLEHEPITIVEEGENWIFQNGRTRVRAVDEANKLRKRNKQPPVSFTLVILPPSDEISTDAKVRIAANIRLDSPPTTMANDIALALSQDVPEEWICKTMGIDMKKMQAYLALLDLPDKVQKLVDSGALTLKAALELTKLDESKVEAAAERAAAAAKVGQRVTAKDIAPSKPGETVATKKEIKQFVLDLQSAGMEGKHADAVVAAFIAGVEICLGFASKNQTASRLHRAAKGETVKYEYGKYQKEGAAKPETK